MIVGQVFVDDCQGLVDQDMSGVADVIVTVLIRRETERDKVWPEVRVQGATDEGRPAVEISSPVAANLRGPSSELGKVSTRCCRIAAASLYDLSS